MITIKKTYIFLLLLFTVLTAQGQKGKLFTPDKELSSSLINRIYQDKDGFIWIATENGLNKYDGTKFTAYNSHPNNFNSLFGDNVLSFLEDTKGHFFIGTVKGLNLYDSDRNQFTPVILSQRTNNLNIASIIELSDGRIWLGTSGHGILQLQFSGNKITAKNILLKNVPQEFITLLYQDKKKNIWISTENRGLYCLTPDHKIRKYFTDTDMTWNNITSICEDKDGTLYAGSKGRGLYRFDSRRNTFKPIVYQPVLNLPVKALYIDSHSGNLLVGTDGYGLKIYNVKTQTITDSELSYNRFNFYKSKIHSILEDNQGNLWLGLYQKGAMIFPSETNNFHYIGCYSGPDRQMGSSCVMSLTKDHGGRLWIGTDNDGLYKIQDNKSIHFPGTGTPNSVPSTIMGIYEDSNHTIWLGSFLSGLAKLNPETGQCSYLPLFDDRHTLVKQVYCFAEDRNRNLWIGTMGGGLFRMSLSKKEATPAFYASTFNRWINTLLCTSDDKLLIGTFDGLSCLDLKTHKMKAYLNTANDKKGYIIYSLHEDSKHNIWIGTTEGLLCFNMAANTWKRYTTDNGLPSNIIQSIQEDCDQNLWISTGHGISCFNIPRQEFVNYSVDDGLQGNEFSKNAGYTAPDGEIFFGGTNGVTAFNPSQMAFSTRKPEIRIIGFNIHNRSVYSGMSSGLYTITDKEVGQATTFQLSNYDNSFTLELSAMEFYNPERITYMYSLNDEEWTYLTPGTNKISFSDLKPGTYRFKIRSKDFGEFSATKEITIVIHPAWYATWWFRTLYLLVIAAVGYYSYRQIKRRYELHKQIQEHIHAEEMKEAKLQFFINISHEIRTPMSLIIGPLQKLVKQEDNGDKLAAYKMILRNAQRILRLINQLMDVRKIDKGQMVLQFKPTEVKGFMEDLCRTFDYEAQQKGIHFTFHPDIPDGLRIYVDPENFDKIIVNLLSNAFKFTPNGGDIDLSLHTGMDARTQGALHHYIEITVADTGTGIEPDKINKIFERFYQIRNSINNSTVGTGIGLHLVKSLVQLHHGSIRVCNNENGKGCRFIVRLPLGKSHLNPKEIAEEVSTNSRITDASVFQEDIIPNENRAKSKSKYRVLVVEDDEDIRHYICNEFSRDFHILECTNGKEALEIILKKNPDLVISDVMMPVMDGLTLCRKIKQNIQINSTPVILLTAKTREEDQVEGLGVGADAYITKPFNIDILRKTAENLIRNRELLKNYYKGNQEQEVSVHVESEMTPDEKLMIRIMRVINDNLGNPGLNVDMISKEVGISRVHLYRKLKELTNQSTRDFIRNIRLKEAARLLKEKGYNITRISQLTGFSSIIVFSRTFKEFYGISPKDYAEQDSSDKDTTTD